MVTHREETSTFVLRLSPRTTEVSVSYSRWVNQSMKIAALQAMNCQTVQGLWIQPWDYESQDLRSRGDFRNSQILVEGFAVCLSADNNRAKTTWLQTIGPDNQPPP